MSDIAYTGEVDFAKIPPTAFRQFVEREAFATSAGQQFETRGAANAAVVTEYLLHTAKSRFRILTQSLGREVYGRSGVQDAAIAFLRRNPKALIFVLSEEEAEPPLNQFAVKMRATDAIDRVIFRTLAGKPFEHKFNFAVADNESFRIEPERDDHVLVQFRARDVAAQLCNAFDKLWAMGEERKWGQAEARQD